MRKKIDKLLCKWGAHKFERIETLNSNNSHIKDHENLILLGYLGMPIEFEHKKCIRCGFEIDEIKENNLVHND